VFPQQHDFSTELSGRGYSILDVFRLCLWSFLYINAFCTLFDDLIVDDLWLNGLNYLQ
jgi:hypothetical protein